MAIRKVGKYFQIDYYDPSGKRIRKNFKKKKDAVAEHAKRQALISENRYLDVKTEYRDTLGQLIDVYTANFQYQASFKTHKARYLDNFKAYFGADTLLTAIRYVDLETYQNRLTTNHKAFHAAIRRAGIDDFRFHDLRHTFASQVLLRGGSLKDIQELLGHKDIRTTMRYAHLTQQSKIDAVNLLNGIGKKPGGHKMVTKLKPASVNI